MKYLPLLISALPLSYAFFSCTDVEGQNCHAFSRTWKASIEDSKANREDICSAANFDESSFYSDEFPMASKAQNSKVSFQITSSTGSFGQISFTAHRLDTELKEFVKDEEATKALSETLNGQKNKKCQTDDKGNLYCLYTFEASKIPSLKCSTIYMIKMQEGPLVDCFDIKFKVTANAFAMDTGILIGIIIAAILVFGMLVFFIYKCTCGNRKKAVFDAESRTGSIPSRRRK
ncbi:hypothetical protein ROZALSC1DRAFT_26671 [Rozella allomycis CSF55]|uniref:Uncharacterized protein n=1 Tax=Rozella allomycis (strain CSF55) TaxID=988480 RepID=A0A4P9YQA1_ROZAC|nr:hypothetical protein ROZALSC1DRAFT_26671 [Rozella allomycis CSF55]